MEKHGYSLGQRFLAMLLCAVMLVPNALVPAFATEATEPAETGNKAATEEMVVTNPNNLFVDKTATLKEDGTYTIDLEAYATGTPITTTIVEGKPLDVVLVIDQSASMAKGSAGATMEETQEVVENFVKALYENGESFGINHRISMCGFAAEGMEGTDHCVDRGYSYTDGQYDQAWINTGLFMNGGFKKYGKAEYTLVKSAAEIDTNRFYLLKWEAEVADVNGEKTGEKVTQFPFIQFGGGAAETWDLRLYSATHGNSQPLKDKNGNAITSNDVLFETYQGKLYKLESHTLQLTSTDYANSWESVAAGTNGTGGINQTILTHISKFAGAGPTRVQYGLKMARHMLENAPDDGVERKKVVVVFADGMPSWSKSYLECIADPAMVEAGMIKEDLGVEIFSVSLAKEKDKNEPIQTEFMTRVSSGCTAPRFQRATFDINAAQYHPSAHFMTYFAVPGICYAKAPLFYYHEGDQRYYQLVAYWNPEDAVFTESFHLSTVSNISVHYITDAGDVLICEGDSVEEINAQMADEPVYEIIEPEVNGQAETNYLLTANNADALHRAFDTVVKEMTTYTSELSLDANAVLKDVLAEGFTLTDNTTITVSVVPGSVSEENSALTAEELTSDKITWGEAQQVLSFAYPTATTGKGTVTVGEETTMTMTAQAGSDGVVAVSGFDYANQFVSYDHDGYKLQVTITGVEADADVTTGALVETNLGTSGIYEGAESDADEDGITGEIQAAFPIPTTYLSSKTYYLDYTGKMTINPADFLMTVKGVNADIDGYNFFDPAAPGTKIETEYGEVTVNENGSITYTLTKDNWEYPDTFYLFGTTEDSTVTGATANADGNMWAKITVVTPKDSAGKLFLDKDATLTSNGTYTINLEAYATGTPITKTVELGVPLDVVLVVDQSGSLKNSGSVDSMKNSIRNFMNALKANGEAVGVDHRVSICSFAGDDLGGLSGPANETYGYSFAGDLWDFAWLNTGLYVDGKFQDYGTVEYTRIDSLDNLDETRSYLVKYTRPLENGSSVAEYFRIYYYKPYASWYIHNGKQGLVSLATRKQDGDNKTTSEDLIANYEVYDIGESTLQLDQADYAASWEYIADGQGNLNADVDAAINSLASNGGTRTSYGLKMARNMLKYITPGTDNDIRKKVVVVFTDGKAGAGWNSDGEMAATLAEANKIKASGVDIYTVGVYSDDVATDIASFMNQFSSNCGVIEFSENPTTEYEYNNLGQNTWVNSVTGRYRTLPSFYKVKNEDGTVEFCPVRVRVETRYTDAAKDWVVTPPYKWTYITDTGEMPIPTELLNEDGTAITGLYKIGSGDYNSEAGYYQTSNSFDNLSSLFQTVLDKETIFSSEVELGTTAILKDVLADGFTLTDNTTITVSVVPGSVSEGNKGLTEEQLTSDKITWGEAQQVLTFNYSEVKEGTGKVIVKDAADQTEMTITATASADGVITVTGYNYADPADNYKNDAQYISYGHPGSKLVVTITGVEAEKDIVTDSITTTNKGTSGIYEGPESDIDGDGEKGEMQASFPIPTTHLTSKVYVVDYAKEMTIDPNDFRMTIGAESLDVDGYNYFNPAVAGITEKYGKVAMKDSKLTYTPTNTNWDGFDTFYVFGTTDDATIKAATANANGNMWSKVSVIPANNVYYEDTFVTDEETGTAGIVYSGSWTEDGASDNQGENAESGENTTADGAQGGVHGWEDSLADDTGYSDGSAHMVSYDSKKSATATFTFTGTGVDIYSRTNEETGIVIAMLYEGASTTDENGKNLIAKYTLMVDNLAASGDYYQIPTLSLCKIPLKVDGKIQKDENGNTIMVDMPHGTYTVRLIVSKATASQTGAERFIYYLDGIRVYNPIRDLEGDETVSGAYGEEELNANFVEIRDKLLDANSFSAEGDGLSEGPVFIDRITDEEGNHTDNTKTFEIGTYKVFGPENEVYLSANQTIAFAVEYREGTHYYIGMKSLTGDNADAWVSTPDNEMDIISIGHTTDLYYEIVPVWTDFDGNYYTDEESNRIGIITVQADFMNGGFAMDENGDLTYEGSILALTKLKVTGPAASKFKFAMVRNSLLLSCAAEAANTDAPEDEDPSQGDENTDPTDPSEGDENTDPTDPSEGVENTDPTDPSEDVENTDPTEPSAPNVDIDNPETETPEEDQYKDELEQMYNVIKQLFERLSRWFKP